MVLVEVVNRTVSTKGTSDTATLQAAFPATPSISGYDNSKVTAVMATLHDGVVGTDRLNSAIGQSGKDHPNPDFPNQSLDYAGVGADTPAVAGDIKTGPGGLPWTAYAPNVVSPGPGSINPADLANPPQTLPRDSGAGSTKLPGETSPQVASQEKAGGGPGNLSKGHSGATP